MQVGTVGNLNNVAKAVKVVKEVSKGKPFNAAQCAQIAVEEKELKSQILSQMTKPVNLLDKMKTFVGEVPNIIINSVGTGLVAPFFIKYNFLSKTDEDTRTYSAWRQPVSAVLAVLTQAGIVIPFNSVINKMSNKGEFGIKAYDKTSYQDKSFIESQIRKENPKLSKAEVKKLAEERQLKQLENMVGKLYDSDTIEYTVNGKKSLPPTDRTEIKKLLNETAEDMLKKAEENVKDGKLEYKKDVNILKKVQKAISENKSIKDIIKETSIDGNKFVYEVAQKHIKKVEAGMKSAKQITGLVVSLAVLPVTCYMLNYIYPRFMNAFFPEITSKKSSQKPQGDTLVKNNVSAQAKEVK